MTRLLIGADAAGAVRQAAAEVARRARGAIAARGRFVLVLAGGATPRELHAQLAAPGGPFAAAIDWSRLHVLFGDERCVPPDHPDSIFRMARETLLARVPIPAGLVHRLHGEDPDPARAAAAHEGELRALFAGGPPWLDLVLLGVGADGHVASLFPGAPALDEPTRWVLPTAPPAGGPRPAVRRLTLTLPLLRAARAVLLLATGADKAGPARAALGGSGSLPVQRIQPSSGDLTVVLDAAAARDLRPDGPAETGPDRRIVV